MGHWKGAIFKEYIGEELAGFSEGMSISTIKKFKFVNLAEGVNSNIVDVISTIMVTDYDM